MSIKKEPGFSTEREKSAAVKVGPELTWVRSLRSPASAATVPIKPLVLLTATAAFIFLFLVGED